MQTTKTRKTETINIRVRGEEKNLLENKAKQARKTLSAYIRYKAKEEHTEWTKQDTIRTWVQIANCIYDTTVIEIPVSFLKCMPLYKWQYCHERLIKQEGYCDGDFSCFLEELERHLICAYELVKLDCLDKTERKKLITLFKRKLKKEKQFQNTYTEQQFLSI
tara:strand:+ start:21 stop:509 length:489 start_codon:yes stop_codon:yes gene_type:complete